jgi:excisionase family DNA binding protein
MIRSTTAGVGGIFAMSSTTNIDSQDGQRVSSSHSNPEIMTLAEAASLLRVHRSTVSRYAMSGELRSYLIGNRRLFKLSDLLSFFENRIAPESQVDQRCVFGKEKCDVNSHYPKTQT